MDTRITMNKRDQQIVTAVAESITNACEFGADWQIEVNGRELYVSIEYGPDGPIVQVSETEDAEAGTENVYEYKLVRV